MILRNLLQTTISYKTMLIHHRFGERERQADVIIKLVGVRLGVIDLSTHYELTTRIVFSS